MAISFIESDTWRLWSDPQMGAQWLAAEVYKDGHWHAVVPDCRSEVKKPAGQSAAALLPAANFHMLPYSNRIRDGRFNFQDQTYQLLNADTHAIHGALRKLPWRLVTENDSHVLCEFDSTQHGPINWPWPISASVSIELRSNELITTLSMTNNGQTDMPAGFGWHPYFVRKVNGSQPTLTLPVSHVFPDRSGDCLPDGEAIAITEELDFRQARRLDPEQRIDCCLAGLSAPCEINWQDGGIKLVLSASEICQYLVLFNPDMPHFAVEPVTNANDAFNLSAQGIESGTVSLAPGKTLNAALSITAFIS